MQNPDPAYDYDKHGQQYSGQRRTDPRIAAQIHRALGAARSVLNVGAGSGSYEPADRYVVAVEPSSVMRQQRVQLGRVPAINAKAGNLPFDDGAFDASMALITVHHWPDIEQGLREMRRVTRGPVVILCFDPDKLDLWWNAHYFSELIEINKTRDPAISRLKNALSPHTEVIPVTVPFDCIDGFQEAFYGRPEAFLNPEVRRAQSAWGFLPEGQESKLVERLRQALESGEWDERYGHLRTQPELTCALRLVIGYPDPAGTVHQH